MKKLLQIFFAITSISSFCQNYIPLDTTDYKDREALLLKIEEQYSETAEKIEYEFNNELAEEINSSYSDLFNLIYDKVENKELVFNSNFTEYIASITKEIIDNNPKLLEQKQITPYVTKHNSVNAFSAGNGYIFLNMGLFNYLDNEAQLVSVLCHEIAHDILEHSKKSIITRAKQEVSLEKKELAKKIKKTKYNRQSEAYSEFKKILYADKKKNRTKEIQADSLGFILFKNTKYDPKEFLNALEKIAEIDSLPEISVNKETYREIFNMPEQSFKEEWLRIESYDNYGYGNYNSKIHKDSIKTHPEIYDRIALIKKHLNNGTKDLKVIDKDNQFDQLKKIAKKESSANLFHLKAYGLSTYLTLYKLQNNPLDNYLKKMIGNNFYEILKAKKAYKFNKYIERIKPHEQDESYIQFLNFIWNLRLSEIEAIAKYYNK